MSWTVVARKDFQDAARSRALWALTVLFVLFLAGFAYLFTLLQSGNAGNDATISALDYVTFLLSPASLLIPITALIIGYKSIAGEVESGSAKLLLSLPHTRRDVVLGKIVGRGLTLAASILVGIVAAAIVVLALYDTFDAASFLVFAVGTLLLGVMYTGIAVGLSGTTKSTSRATVYAAGFYILFEIVWGFVANAIYYLLHGTFQPPLVATGPHAPYLDAPGWYFFVQGLSPTSAYTRVVQMFANSSATFFPAFRGGLPVYLSRWASLVVMLAWFVVVPLVGYYVFDRADL